MDNVDAMAESGVKDRLYECMSEIGLSKFDARIVDLGIPKHKLQSMWRNTTGDVPGIILEKMCRAFPELDAVYICSGKSSVEDKDKMDKDTLLQLCRELISNYKQRDCIIDKLVSMTEFK